jgi:hypothetical protein
MKAGCLAILATMVIAFGFYYKLLTDSSDPKLAEMWWLAFIFALVAGMIVGNIHGVLLALRQKKASNKTRSEWRDGELLVVSGRIQSTRSPLSAPFSGTSAAILEYKISTKSYSNDSNTKIDHFSGFMMTPCAVQTLQGTVNLVGFPLLAKVPSTTCWDESNFKNAAEFLKRTKFEEKHSNPITMLKQMNEVLKDSDGDVQSHFVTANHSFETQLGSIQTIMDELQDRGVQLEETLIPNGAEVTASGTYRAARQAIDIGDGMSNITHSLQLGTAAQLTGGLMKQSIIMLAVLEGAFVAGNYFLLKHLGMIH